MPMQNESRSCPQEEFVPAFVLGELCGEELARFEEHLRACSYCQAEVVEVRLLIQTLRQVPDEVTTSELTLRILEKVRETPSPPRKRLLPVALPLAAGLLLAILGGWLLIRHGRATDPLERSLSWLAAVQEPDGSWSAEKWGGQRNYTIGVTSFALLAFLKSGERPLDGPFAQHIRKGIQFILSQQTPDGFFSPLCSGVPYNHGLATTALLEAYRITGDPRLRGPLDRAIRCIRSTQTERGGWSYFQLPSPNTSISVWQVHALLLADSLGWHEARENARKAVAWLSSLVDDEGYFGYREPGDFPYGRDTVTAMGASCLLLYRARSTADVPLSPALLRSLRQVAAKMDQGYCHSYFLALSASAPDGQFLRKQLRQMRKALVERQLRIGEHAGSWEPSDRWGTAGGRVYSTALAAMSLESAPQ